MGSLNQRRLLLNLHRDMVKLLLLSLLLDVGRLVLGMGRLVLGMGRHMGRLVDRLVLNMGRLVLNMSRLIINWRSLSRDILWQSSCSRCRVGWGS